MLDRNWEMMLKAKSDCRTEETTVEWRTQAGMKQKHCSEGEVEVHTRISWGIGGWSQTRRMG